MSAAVRPRFKNTFPPPTICQCCYWREKYARLESTHKALRKELIRVTAQRRPPKDRLESDAREAYTMVSSIEVLAGSDLEAKAIVDHFTALATDDE